MEADVVVADDDVDLAAGEEVAETPHRILELVAVHVGALVEQVAWGGIPKRGPGSAGKPGPQRWRWHPPRKKAASGWWTASAVA